MNVATKKSELINWISSINDSNLIDQMDDFRKTHSSFNFKKEIKSAISSEELKNRTTKFIKSLEWKK
ncbi:hypothetical protein [Flavobacterium sp.]|uniref:hypothetical protein n=1 Tax=Flavobacterium sp. TaxID=239 RepID=UPI00374FF876